MNEAIAAIEALDSIHAPVVRIRMEHLLFGLSARTEQPLVATLLHLLVPGLLQRPDGTDPALFRRPRRHWNGYWLAPIPARVPATLDATLFELFGLPAPIDADLPVAALTRFDVGWRWRLAAARRSGSSASRHARRRVVSGGRANARHRSGRDHGAGGGVQSNLRRRRSVARSAPAPSAGICGYRPIPASAPQTLSAAAGPTSTRCCRPDRTPAAGTPC